MNKHSFTTWVRPLVALLLLATSYANAFADFTVWVYGNISSAPAICSYNDGLSLGNQYLDEGTVTNSTGTWYYKTFSPSSTGSSSFRICTNTSWEHESCAFTLTDPSGDYYYYYNGSNYALDLTPVKGKTSFLFFDRCSDWAVADGSCVIWDGFANVLTKYAGGTKDGNNVYYYASDNNVSGTIYFKRYNPDGTTDWNTQASATYDKGYVYNSTSNTNVTKSSSTYASVVYPEKPVLVEKTVTIHLIDKAHGTTPNLYAQVTGDNSTTFLGEWPGTAVTNAAFTTETIKGETWWKTTISTTAASIQVTPNIGGTTWQTKDLTIDTSNSDWYIVLDSWVASPGSNKSNAACAHSAATAPAGAVKHSTTWYLHGTVTTDQSWAHDLVPTDNGDDTYKWTATLKSGYNYYFFVSDRNSSNWDDLKRGHIYSASASDNTSISLGTEYNCVAQTVTGNKGNYHYYCQASAVHYFTYNAKTGKLTVSKETIDPNTGKLYLIGLVAPEGQTLTNEWAANLGVEMTKATDGNNVEYFYINNVKLMSLNSGFGFATRLGNDADDWTTLNACRYGAKVVNTGDTQKVLYTEMIQTGTEGADNDPAHWHETYGIGESQNTFTVEISDTYNIKFYPAHDGMAPTVHLYAASFPDVMYAITGVVDSSNAAAGTWDLKKPVQLAHDTENDVYTAEVSLSPGTLLTFSRHLGNWEHINSSRYGAPSGTGTSGYWIQNNETVNNLGYQITGLQSGLSSWSDNNAEAFVIKTNKSGLFRITLSTTESWVMFEQLWEAKGDKVHVYLEATDNISTPLISAYDKESWSNDDGRGNIHVDRPKFSVLIGTDPDYSNKHRLCLAKDQAPAAELHETDDKRTWYSWEIDHTIADFILTNNGKAIDNVNANADDTDTSDEYATNIIWRHSGEIYLRWNEDGQLDDYTRDYDETAAQEAPVVTKMIDGHYYCYFINTAKWPQSYIHAWFTNSNGVNEDLLGAYPGKQLTDMVGYDEDGNEVWLFDFGPISSFEGKEPTGIIFSIGMSNGMQTGDYEFVNGAVYDYTGTVVLGRDLGNIIAKGVKDGETRYIIEDDIVAVYYDPIEKALYCKDLNKYITIPGSVERSVQQDGEIDYARTTTNKLKGQMASDRYDQSNWIKLKVHNATGDEYYTTAYQSTLEDFARNRNVLKAGTVRGVLPNVKNPTMEIVKLDNGGTIQTNGTSTYASNVTKSGATVNVFTPAHFVGSQPGRVSGRNYFFVTPKPNEYARVTWAVCTAVNGNTATFAIPESKYQGGGEYDNEDKLQGGFTADLSKVSAVPTVGKVYSFPAIITLKESSSSGNAPRRVPDSYNGGDAGTPAYDYVVYPLSLSDVTTGVTEVNTSKTVANVTYVNIAGMQSAEPFDGVNIVVTTYTDGTRSAVKVIR